MDCLKAETIILFNHKAKRRHGGFGGGIKSSGDLENLQDYILMVAEAMDEWDEINSIAFAAYQIVKKHIFWDANKRTAQFVIVNCLRKSGFSYTGRPIDLARKLEEVAASDANQKEYVILSLVYFLKSHLQKR